MKNILTTLIALALGTSITLAAPSKRAAKPDKEPAAAQKSVAQLSSTQKDKLLALVNAGKAADLVAVRGIGEARAAAVVKARPFQSVDEVTKVRGIGDVVFANLISHATSPVAKSKKKAAAKPAAPKAPAAKASAAAKAPAKSAEAKAPEMEPADGE